MEQQATQAGEAKEQPKEVSPAASEATSVEEKATSIEATPKARTEEEFRKLQSMKDKAEAVAQTRDKELKAVQGQISELQTAIERQRLEARKKEVDALEGDPDAQRRMLTMHDLEDQRNKLEKDMKGQQDALVRKYNQATELASQFNVPITELLNAETPREMELMAQVMSVKPKETKESFTPDSGASDAGGDTDEVFIKRYSEGKSDDHDRARKVLAKL